MKYEKPDIEIVLLETENVICTSIGESESGDNDDGFN